MTEFTVDRLKGLLSTQGVTWRHDVDYFPSCALQMACLEHELGVRATYYLRPNGYQLRPVLQELGHQVGVHVDLGLPRDAHTTPPFLASRAEVAYSVLQPGSRKVSFHAPPRSVYWQWVPGFDHALGPEWEDRYIADSRGVWRDNPEQFLARVDRPQANLHPEWWFLPPDQADDLRTQEALKP